MISTDKRHVSAIILAGGSGSRMNTDTTKQRLLIGGMSMLRRSVHAFEKCQDVDEIVVIVREDEIDFARSELADVKKLTQIGIGGKTRAESSENGTKLVSPETEIIAIHDAARPLITPEMISDVVLMAKEKGAATLASPVIDTIKVINNEGNIEYTPKRSMLVRATTPQVFLKGLYEKALKSVKDKSFITDDNMLLEEAGYKVFAVISDRENPKLTTPSDIPYIEMLLNKETENE